MDIVTVNGRAYKVTENRRVNFFTEKPSDDSKVMVLSGPRGGCYYLYTIDGQTYDMMREANGRVSPDCAVEFYN